MLCSAHSSSIRVHAAACYQPQSEYYGMFVKSSTSMEDKMNRNCHAITAVHHLYSKYLPKLRDPLYKAVSWLSGVVAHDKLCFPSSIQYVAQTRHLSHIHNPSQTDSNPQQTFNSSMQVWQRVYCTLQAYSSSSTCTDLLFNEVYWRAEVNTSYIKCSTLFCLI